MSKNDKITSTVKKVNNMLEDEYFKELMKFKLIAALVVKFTVREVKDWELISIAKAIEDNNPRNPNMTDTEILGSEVDFKNMQYGNLDEKSTIADTVFTLKWDNKQVDIIIGNRLLVNMEMQQETRKSKLGYDIVSRAIYYGASALRSTVAQGDTKYTGICKAYSIWFCAKSLDLEEFGGTKEGYKNVFKIVRTFDDINLVRTSEENYDLMEIIMIDLPKLCKVSNKDTELIKTLFYNTKEIVPAINESFNIQFNEKEVEGVRKVMDFVKELEVQRVKSELKGKIEVYYSELEWTIEQIAEKLKIPAEQVQEIIDNIINEV